MTMSTSSLTTLRSPLAAAVRTRGREKCVCHEALCWFDMYLGQRSDDNQHVALHHIQMPPRCGPTLPHQRLRIEISRTDFCWTSIGLLELASSRYGCILRVEAAPRSHSLLLHQRLHMKTYNHCDWPTARAFDSCHRFATMGPSHRPLVPHDRLNHSIALGLSDTRRICMNPHFNSIAK